MWMVLNCRPLALISLCSVAFILQPTSMGHLKLHFCSKWVIAYFKLSSVLSVFRLSTFALFQLWIVMHWVIHLFVGALFCSPVSCAYIKSSYLIEWKSSRNWSLSSIPQQSPFLSANSSANFKGNYKNKFFRRGVSPLYAMSSTEIAKMRN